MFQEDTKDQCGLIKWIKAEYKYSYGYQNWYPSVENETKNTKKNVGLFELSPFSKFDLKGDKAHEDLTKNLYC